LENGEDITKGFGCAEEHREIIRGTREEVNREDAGKTEKSQGKRAMPAGFAPLRPFLVSGIGH